MKTVKTGQLYWQHLLLLDSSKCLQAHSAAALRTVVLCECGCSCLKELHQHKVPNQQGRLVFYGFQYDRLPGTAETYSSHRQESDSEYHCLKALTDIRVHDLP